MEPKRCSVGGAGMASRHTMHGFEHSGIPALFAFLAIAAEFCGGIGLFMGLLGRVAAFGIALRHGRSDSQGVMPTASS